MTLVILAAGMGSRFGGLKQVEKIDDEGNFIIDYSVYDAVRAGFDKIVFDGVIETHTRQTLDSRESSSTGTSSSNSSSSGDTDNRYSDTPQNNISDVKDGSYVTDYTFNQTSSNSSASTTSGSHSNDSGRVDEEIRIVRGDPIEEYSKYLEVMNSIYEMIFKECDSLFYGII